MCTLADELGSPASPQSVHGPAMVALQGLLEFQKGLLGCRHGGQPDRVTDKQTDIKKTVKNWTDTLDAQTVRQMAED